MENDSLDTNKLNAEELDAETLARLARIKALVKHLNGDTLDTPKGNFKRDAMNDPNRTQMKGTKQDIGLTEEELKELMQNKSRPVWKY